MKMANEKWPIKQFLVLDAMAIGFGIIYFYIVNLLGTDISVVNAVTAAFIYWVLSVLVYGFSGKLRTNIKA